MNNMKGVVGVAPGVELRIVKVFDDDNNWAYSSGIAYAADACVKAGANIISMSLGGDKRSPAEEDAFDSYGK